MAQKIRLGLIGASVRGTWSSRSHLPAARASAEIELTAVYTTRADSAEAARAAYGARLAFDDWRKMVTSPPTAERDAVSGASASRSTSSDCARACCLWLSATAAC
jgi:predicted dehydrogenase